MKIWPFLCIYFRFTTYSFLCFPSTNSLFCLVFQPLDYEAQSEYTLHLRVENLNTLSNKAPNLPASTATVVVTVLNENEAPHFREDPIQIEVPESVLPGTLLKSNIAFDPDNSDLRYDIAAKNQEYFPVCKNACN